MEAARSGAGPVTGELASRPLDQEIAMTAATRSRLVASTLLLAALSGGAVHSASVPFRTHFGADTVGLPPGIGGYGQPNGMNAPAGASVAVVDELLGLETKPVELDSPTGAATWLYWNLFPAVSDLGVSIRFSVSFEEAVVGNFFDASGPGGIRVRLSTTGAGALQLNNGCGFTPIDSFTPGTPVDVILLFEPPATYWALVDPEGNGFDDDLPVAGESCNPGDLTQIYAYAWSPVGDSVRVAFDDLVVDWLPIFVDDFETGDTEDWSATTP